MVLQQPGGGQVCVLLGVKYWGKQACVCDWLRVTGEHHCPDWDGDTGALVSPETTGRSLMSVSRHLLSELRFNSSSSMLRPFLLRPQEMLPTRLNPLKKIHTSVVGNILFVYQNLSGNHKAFLQEGGAGAGLGQSGLWRIRDLGEPGSNLPTGTACLVP